MRRFIGRFIYNTRYFLQHRNGKHSFTDYIKFIRAVM